MMKYEKKDFAWVEEFDDRTLGEMRHIINALSDKFGDSSILRYYQCYDNIEYWIDVEKKETDAERAARELQEAARKKKKEDADRKKFEKLKDEYGW